MKIKRLALENRCCTVGVSGTFSSPGSSVVAECKSVGYPAGVVPGRDQAARSGSEWGHPCGRMKVASYVNPGADEPCSHFAPLPSQSHCIDS